MNNPESFATWGTQGTGDEDKKRKHNATQKTKMIRNTDTTKRPG